MRNTTSYFHPAFIQGWEFVELTEITYGPDLRNSYKTQEIVHLFHLTMLLFCPFYSRTLTNLPGIPAISAFICAVVGFLACWRSGARLLLVNSLNTQLPL
jgi:hypothetical protein